MQFIKVKIEDIKTKESSGLKKGIYDDIYNALKEFTNEAFKEGSEIVANDEKNNVQWYKVHTVNRSITAAKNPIDSIEANIRAYMKRSDWKPAIKYAVQFTDATKLKIDIFARKMETSEPAETSEPETKTAENDVKTDTEEEIL